MRMNCQRLVLSAIALVAILYTKPCESCRGTLLATGITAQDRIDILETHNRLRQTVAQGSVPGQPAAANMQEMVWDDELAAKAQQWSTQCIFQHDPNRYSNRFIMGQNLAIIWSTASLDTDTTDFTSRIYKWFNEVRKYAFGSGWSSATGHYSQLVWGDTHLVGCGFSYYKDGAKYNKLFVCNYGPGGNVVGSAPYAVGSPSCSNYGMQPSARYTGLCSRVGGGSSFDPTATYFQDTYTFKTETINPPKYATTVNGISTYTPFATAKPKTRYSFSAHRRPVQPNTFKSYFGGSNTGYSNNYNTNYNSNYNSFGGSFAPSFGGFAAAVTARPSLNAGFGGYDWERLLGFKK